MAKRCEECPILLKESRFYATVLFRPRNSDKTPPDNLFANPEKFLADRADVNIEELDAISWMVASEEPWGCASCVSLQFYVGVFIPPYLWGSVWAPKVRRMGHFIPLYWPNACAVACPHKSETGDALYLKGVHASVQGARDAFKFALTRFTICEDVVLVKSKRIQAE